jgi:hypothetical protein
MALVAVKIEALISVLGVIPPLVLILFLAPLPAEALW